MPSNCITVCASCLRASCWQGVFLCYESQNADVVYKPVKELALLIGHLTETRQLLKGEPTKIISVEDRRHWDELGVALLHEVERRNLKYDLPPSQFQEMPLNNG